MTGVISTEAVAGRIYSIRGQKVMLDRDLAELYGVATKALKQAVRRNAERFPEDFMFEAVFTALRRLLEPEDEPPRKIGFTAREKRQPYGGSAAVPAPAFTPAAKKRWERIPPKLQAMLLGNVWCRTCREAGDMVLLSGKIEKGQLVLRGTCTACGEPVARVVERD